MIELKKEIRKKGRTLTQIFKDEDIVIYRVDRRYDNGTDGYWFEVFKPVIHCKDTYHNDCYELYPSDEAFGKWAWCCGNEKSLVRIINEHFPKHKCDEIPTSCTGSVA